MFEERCLPDAAARAIRWHDMFTSSIALALVFGPIVVPSMIFGWESEEWPDGWWKLTYALPFLGMPLWYGFWEWRFRHHWPCPNCSGRLKSENRPSTRGKILLTCTRCQIHWNSNREYVEPRYDNGG
jgi:hypothetical protein